ncbi:MAG: DUF4143 domain-containing protein [Sphingobacteriales bacterium]|nr:MAG: DUF4143 domain-containing protein [Sphingobacteriales bacterium]
MYFRNIDLELLTWKTGDARKPLILRGARQVGKTSAVSLFAKNYKQYIPLNLEKFQDADLFIKHNNIKNLIEAIFFLYNQDVNYKHQTLIFIDEIQDVPQAINTLRYFYEEYPEIHVIAAGSLLETVLSENISIPVGRVEFSVLRPVSFYEFLGASAQTQLQNMIDNTDVPEYAHNKMMEYFYTYSHIGGMPEVVANYIVNKNFNKINKIYDSLLVAYQNDFEKYAKNNAQINILRHILTSMGSEIGNRIKFQHFANSNYGSKEVSEALRVLEKAMLVKLVYPTISTKYPIQNDYKKSPRLQFLDTGLFNKLAGIQKDFMRTNQVESVHQGKVAEHIVGQELLTHSYSPLHDIKFWTRENKDANAEVDYLYEYEGLLIPLEVKLGAAGRLRSLHSFIDKAEHNIGIRVSSNYFSVENVKTIAGKNYKLLNVPFYLLSSLNKIVTNQL